MLMLIPAIAGRPATDLWSRQGLSLRTENTSFFIVVSRAVLRNGIKRQRTIILMSFSSSRAVQPNNLKE